MYILHDHEISRSLLEEVYVQAWGIWDMDACIEELVGDVFELLFIGWWTATACLWIMSKAKERKAL